MKKEKASYDIRGDRNHSWEKREIAGSTASFGSPTEKRGQNGSCWIPSKLHAEGGRRLIEYRMGNWERHDLRKLAKSYCKKWKKKNARRVVVGCAEEILANNQVPLQVFRDAVCDPLIEGRGKYRNIMITGNANCGKTFLLNPLTLIFNTFCNPASGSFAWVGVQNAECIFLNDFRWSPQVIPWHSSGMICYLC